MNEEKCVNITNNHNKLARVNATLCKKVGKGEGERETGRALEVRLNTSLTGRLHSRVARGVRGARVPM